jgi:acyl-CoA synthetase (AMP-forming)/AMP-acid ligase II
VVWQNLSRYCLDNDVKLPSIQTVITVGAPIPAYLHRRFRKILSEGAQIWTPYGATEGLPVSYIATDEILTETWERTAKGHGTCVGHPAPGMEIAVIGITEDPIPTWSDDLRVPDGQVGEVVIKGMAVSPEYKDVPGANALAKITDGDTIRHRMGDLGYLDERGRLWFCGRKAHRLQTVGGMIAAVPIEGVFNEHPDVFRTALIGVGSTGNEIPVLCVEMEPGKSWSAEVEAALVALAAETHHADVVQRFLHHPSFPTDARHNSKIRREDLKPWAQARCTDLVGLAAA